MYRIKSILVVILLKISLVNNSFSQDSLSNDVSVNLISLLKIGTSYSNYYDNPVGILYKKSLGHNFKLRFGLDMILRKDAATDEYFRRSGQVHVSQSYSQSIVGSNLYSGNSVVGHTDTSITIQYNSYYTDPKPYLKIGVEKVVSLKWIKLSFGLDLVGSFGWNNEFIFNQEFEIDTSSAPYYNYPYYTSFHNTRTNDDLQTPIFSSSTRSISIGVSPNINFIIPIKTRWEINVGSYFHALFTREKIKTYDYQLDETLESKKNNMNTIGYYRVGNISIHYKF